MGALLVSTVMGGTAFDAFIPLDNPRGQYHGPIRSANREVKFMGENMVWPEVGLSRIGDILLDVVSK